MFAVGYIYLKAIADEARIETAAAQVETAKALYDQAADQVNAGTSPEIDGLRAKVELQSRQQQLIQAKNHFAIQKLTVARVIGLAPGQEFDFTDKSPYHPFEAHHRRGSAEPCLFFAVRLSRSDGRCACCAILPQSRGGGYFPSLSFNADYGTAGSHPSTATSGIRCARNTFDSDLSGQQRSWRDILQADAQTAAEPRAPG